MGLNKTNDNVLFLVETENLKITPKQTCSPVVESEVKVKSLSRVQLFATPWTVAR